MKTARQVALNSLARLFAGRRFQALGVRRGRDDGNVVAFYETNRDLDLSVAGSEAPASVGPTKLLEDCPDYWRVPGSIPGVGLTQKRPFINKEKKR